MTHIYNKNELYHYGTKGQKWGVRNYQNEDGSYTSKGKAENGGHGRYSKFSYGDKEGFIKKQKRLYKAQRDAYRLHTINKKNTKYNNKKLSEYDNKIYFKNIKKEYKDKYGFDYDDAYKFGVKTADKIAKTAHDKNISNEKATNIVLMKQLAISGLLMAGTYGIMKYAEKNPEEFNKILSTASETIKKGANYASYYTKKGVDELKSRLDPNVINVKPKVIPKEVYQLPYKMFENNYKNEFDKLREAREYSKRLLDEKEKYTKELADIYLKFPRLSSNDSEAEREFIKKLDEVRSKLRDVNDRIKKDTNYNSIFQDKVMDYYAIKDNIRLKKNN